MKKITRIHQAGTKFREIASRAIFCYDTRMKNNGERFNNPETSRNYKQVVQEIKDLNWENLDSHDLQRLMHLSHVSAVEFAEALRIANRLYPEDGELKEMSAGELETQNLEFEGYKAPGDHAEFLQHFLEKYGLSNDPDLMNHGEEYLKACRQLPDEVRAMTIFSREEELSGIFERVLEAKDWSADGLPAFQYYLRKHIELDSHAGGHHDLTKKFPIDEKVAPFYEARLEMYKAIPKLFESR
jgi:hypothetical protein